MSNLNKKQKNYSNMLILLSCFVYFVSYITRKNYSVALVSIVESTGFTKSDMGIVESMLLLSYGVGQIISGILGDKFKPQNVILGGLIVTTLCNLLFPLFDSIVAFAIIWGINGMAQAMFWPPLVKIMAEYLSEKKYKYACAQISSSAQIATVLLYLLVPLLLNVLSWQWIFYLASAVGLIMIAVWSLFYNSFANKCQKVDTNQSQTENAPTAPNTKINIAPIAIACGIITILISIALQGFLRDGITTWMPDLVTTFGFSTNTSIMMSVMMPLFSIAATYLITFIYTKFFKNELTASSVFFTIASLAICLMYVINVFAPSNALWAVISVMLAALSVGLMHGINIMLISYVPVRFSKYGAVGSLSGITNAFTYVGSSVSTYIIPLFATALGWSATLLLWLAISVAGIICCLITVRRWGKFISQSK